MSSGDHGWIEGVAVGADPVLYVCPMRYCGTVYREPGECRRSAKHFVGGCSTTTTPIPLVRYERAGSDGRPLLPRGTPVALAARRSGFALRTVEVELRLERSANRRDALLRVFATLLRRRHERERIIREEQTS